MKSPFRRLLLHRGRISLDGVMMAGSVTGLALLFADAVHTGRAPTYGATPASECPPPETHLSSNQIEILESTGYLIVDDFLTKEQVQEARRAIETLDENGRFSKNSPNNDEDVRTDRTFMSEDNSLEVRGLVGVRKEVASFARGLTDSTFDGFVGKKNRNKDDDNYSSSRLNMPHTMQVSIYGCTSGNKSEAQYFTSHLDSARSETFLELGLLGWLRSYYLRQRYMTCIVYLNEDWKPGDGGCLRLHHNEAKTFSFESDGFLDVEPIAGRLVIFSSLDQWHAVLPTFATRFACSFWLTMK